jgi:7,8-dihydropterin-6-yl-methyl-4-(beta-D-ribofuranosyl)aminobenzene 5'-phosphate synthase
MRITTLVENHVNKSTPSLKAEHGVSFYIEIGDHVYMSDVGQSGNFADNAEKLGVDLGRVETLAISHHHYDHGGGLGRFFEENDDAVVYLHTSPNADYLAVDSPDSVRFIGLDRGLLKDHQARIYYIDESEEVSPGFYLLAEIPEKYPKPHGDERLKIRIGDTTKPDPFKHEMVTVVEEDGGLVVLTGCAHNGVLNMVTAAQTEFPGKSIQAVIGGFHLHHETDQTVREIGKALLEMNIPRVITGHCTGDHQTDLLADVLGDRLERLYTGLIITI